jgi:prevent-host-death family protein
METVGIRELKANLSRHLKRVRAGVRLAVTERGRTIATINPIAPSTDVDWAHQMVAEGHAQWNGGKPAGAARPPKVTRKTASAAVLDDRR